MDAKVVRGQPDEQSRRAQKERLKGTLPQELKVEKEPHDDDDFPEFKARTITTAVVLSPNMWAALNKEMRRRGKGTSMAGLIREAIAAHFPGATDEVQPRGSYDRTDFQRRNGDSD